MKSSSGCRVVAVVVGGAVAFSAVGAASAGGTQNYSGLVESDIANVSFEIKKSNGKSVVKDFNYNGLMNCKGPTATGYSIATAKDDFAIKRGKFGGTSKIKYDASQSAENIKGTIKFKGKKVSKTEYEGTVLVQETRASTAGGRTSCRTGIPGNSGKLKYSASKEQ